MGRVHILCGQSHMKEAADSGVKYVSGSGADGYDSVDVMMAMSVEVPSSEEDSPTEETKTESNVEDDGSKDVNAFGGRKPRYRDRRYHPRRDDHVADRDDRYRDDPIRSMGLKIEILEFTSKVHPDDFIDWLSTVERVFDVRDIPDKLKVKLVAIKLRQHASLCY
ncbi:hypothetical protein Tco_0424758 [Tanacetum coccineum]